MLTIGSATSQQAFDAHESARTVTRSRVVKYKPAAFSSSMRTVVAPFSPQKCSRAVFTADEAVARYTLLCDDAWGSAVPVALPVPLSKRSKSS